ncbi:MAG: hypothetical protein A2W22_04435 [Candidatus Levybacteria bacterium RBG_16_35_11]|nr:MAG: hypothetical protein A2W22_04435 [Candidatus Levybacteria bacterium RBG_16_35_11]
MKFSIFLLSCKDKKEAERIEKKLFGEKLIICSKKIEVNSSYLWKKQINNGSEVLLLMESYNEYFERINKEVRKLHSYETYTLYSVPIGKMTKEAKNWIKEELG